MIIGAKTYEKLKLAIIHKISDFDEYIAEMKIWYDSNKKRWYVEFEIDDTFREREEE